MNAAEPVDVPALVWFSRTGAERGLPWAVRHSDGHTDFWGAVQITGTVQFVEAPEGDLVDGPRFVAKLVDGSLIAGK